MAKISFKTRYGIIDAENIPDKPTILGYYMIGKLGPFLHVYVPIESVGEING